MKRLAFIITIAASLLAASCSVKEDRSNTPCWLYVYMNNAADFSEDAFLAGWGDTGLLYSETVPLADRPEHYKTPVPKGFITSSALLNATSSRISGDNVVIPYGQECDRYFASMHDNVNCTGERGRDDLEIHKEHAMLYFKGASTATGVMSFRIYGTVKGMSLRSLEPLAGEFSAYAHKNENGWMEVCLPRQKDDDLMLEVQLDGAPYMNVAIGDLIARTEYSWTNPDLDDIYLQVTIGQDTGEATISISVSEWNRNSVNVGEWDEKHAVDFKL